MADAIVRIWWFTWPGAHMLGGGHGSLQLPPPERAYITWLDGDERERILADDWKLVDDQMLFQGSPDPEEIKIPLRDRTHFGLSGEKIRAWWRQRKRERSPYQLISKEYNCVAAVVLALCAGGAYIYEPPPHNYIYQGANTLVSWVRKLSERIMQVQHLNERALQVLENASVEKWEANDWGEERPEIWSVTEWKTWSNITGIRREQAYEIDQLLPMYHASPPGEPWHRYEIAGRILALSVDHLTKKPNSKRRPAMLLLGRQVYDKMRDLEENHTA